MITSHQQCKIRIGVASNIIFMIFDRDEETLHIDFLLSLWLHFVRLNSISINLPHPQFCHQVFISFSILSSLTTVSSPDSSMLTTTCLTVFEVGCCLCLDGAVTVGLGVVEPPLSRWSLRYSSRSSQMQRAFLFLPRFYNDNQCLRKGKLLSFLMSPHPLSSSAIARTFSGNCGNFISDFVGFNPNVWNIRGKSIKIFPSLLCSSVVSPYMLYQPPYWMRRISRDITLAYHLPFVSPINCFTTSRVIEIIGMRNNDESDFDIN